MLKSQTVSCTWYPAPDGCPRPAGSSLSPSFGPPTLQSLRPQALLWASTPSRLKPRTLFLATFPSPPWPCSSSPDKGVTFPQASKLLLARSLTPTVALPVLGSRPCSAVSGPARFSALLWHFWSLSSSFRLDAFCLVRSFSFFVPWAFLCEFFLNIRVFKFWNKKVIQLKILVVQQLFCKCDFKTIWGWKDSRFGLSMEREKSPDFGPRDLGLVMRCPLWVPFE